MITRAVHGIMPLAVIASAVALCITGRVESSTAVAMIGAAGGVGTVAISGRSPTPPK